MSGRRQIAGASKALAQKRGSIMFPDASTPALPLEIGTAELSARLQSAEPPLVAEILGRPSFDSGHLPGAVNLPLEGFAERAEREMPNKSAEIVVYCASSTCHNSDVAARKLLSLGYQRVRLYRGGKAAWKEAGLALSVA